ncbi:hypothetical protein C8F04DRAFT_1190556 [Mycena alexandri]|uniref:Uncharacterized protein n=1 Tax=Mycena alexandri TaxID=1745969 RepID=A0AAD6SGE9_9AGAR|nr:hypothetical protein C8F04DRAFT_1190556 [Mycena alexandri]
MFIGSPAELLGSILGQSLNYGTLEGPWRSNNFNEIIRRLENAYHHGGIIPTARLKLPLLSETTKSWQSAYAVPSDDLWLDLVRPTECAAGGDVHQKGNSTFRVGASETLCTQFLFPTENGKHLFHLALSFTRTKKSQGALRLYLPDTSGTTQEIKVTYDNFTELDTHPNSPSYNSSVFSLQSKPLAAVAETSESEDGVITVYTSSNSGKEIEGFHCQRGVSSTAINLRHSVGPAKNEKNKVEPWVSDSGVDRTRGIQLHVTRGTRYVARTWAIRHRVVPGRRDDGTLFSLEASIFTKCRSFYPFTEERLTELDGKALWWTVGKSAKN